MICANCGAEIGEKDAHCPYCGVLNPRAAEKKYMDQLESIREDTEKLMAVPEEQARAGVRKAGRLAVVIFCIVAAVIGALAMVGRVMDRAGGDYVRDEAAFKEAYFPKLDALYEAGDDDATADYMEELYGLDGSSVLRVWEHYKYVLYYSDYRVVAAVRDLPQGEKLDKYDYEEVVFRGLELIYQTETSSKRPMTEEEKEKVRGYKEEAGQILAEYLSLDEAALEEIYQACAEEDGTLYSHRFRGHIEKTGGYVQ